MAKTIGTRFESTLHRDLKFSYAGEGGETEAEVSGFVADAISAQGEFIEVQTGSFGPLKKKVNKLTRQGKVRIVYPIIVTKYLDVFDANGKRASRRKSPVKESPWNLFYALVYAPELPLIRGVVIELVLVDALEIRIRDGKGSWRRGGVSIKDRQMLAFHERITLKKPSDYYRFVPFVNSEEFTSGLLAEKAGIRINLARKVLYVLTQLGLVEKTGKQKNAILYRIITPKKPAKRKTTT